MKLIAVYELNVILNENSADANYLFCLNLICTTLWRRPHCPHLTSEKLILREVVNLPRITQLASQPCVFLPKASESRQRRLEPIPAPDCM